MVALLYSIFPFAFLKQSHSDVSHFELGQSWFSSLLYEKEGQSFELKGSLCTVSEG